MPEELFGFSIKVEKDPSRLVVEPADGVPVTHYQVEMIAGNSIPGLLSATVRRRDEQFGICYDTQNYVPLGGYLREEGVTRDEFLLFINHLKNIFKESRKYFLGQDSFVLAERYIFVKKGLKDIALLYIPANILQDINNSLKDLIINIIAHSPDAGDPAMASFLKSAREGIISLSNLDQYIRQFFVREDPLKTLDPLDFWASYTGSGRPDYPCGPGDPPRAGKGKDSDQVLGAGRCRGKNVRLITLGAIGVLVSAVAVISLIGEKTVGLQAAAGLITILGSAGAVFYVYIKTREKINPEEQNTGGKPSAGEGVIKSPAARAAPVPVIYKNTEKRGGRLPEGKKNDDSWKGPVLITVREGKQEKIIIDKNEFFIGRNKVVADYGDISDHRVEKLHVKIIKRETGCRIVDLDTVSGTYVNGKRIASNIPYPINYKDVIGLAGEEFIFEEGK